MGEQMPRSAEVSRGTDPFPDRGGRGDADSRRGVWPPGGRFTSRPSGRQAASEWGTEPDYNADLDRLVSESPFAARAPVGFKRLITGFLVTGGRENFPVEVYNVSSTGFHLRLHGHVNRGQTVVVELHTAAGNSAGYIEGWVAQVHSLPDGAYALGCVFARPPAAKCILELAGL